jgi:hypothetical protein
MADEFSFRPTPYGTPRSLVRIAPGRIGMRVVLPNGDRGLVPMSESVTFRMLFRPPFFRRPPRGENP